MTCAQLRISIFRKICYLKSGFQTLYAEEHFHSLFSKDKLKARGTHTPTHDPPSIPTHVVGELLCGSEPTAPTCVVWSWRLKQCFALTSAALETRVFPVYWLDDHAMLMAPWLSLTLWYSCAHAWGTGRAVCWCFFAPCWQFSLMQSLIN